MVITLNLLQFITTIATLVIGGGFALWNIMSGKIDKATKELEARITALETKQMAKDDIMRELGEIKTRLQKMENAQGNFVSRDEHQRMVEGLDRALSGVSAAITQQSNTITQRIDGVMFEIGRQRKDEERNR